VDKETRSSGFLVWPQDQGRRVSRILPPNVQLWFGDLGLKIIVTDSWFGPQNQPGDSLSVAPQNQWEENGTGHVLNSSGLLRLEASQARVSQFALKLAEVRRWVVHVASPRRSREDEAEDRRVDVTGCIKLFYPYFVIFIVLGARGILVFWMSL
jgi:hypothetical protein